MATGEDTQGEDQDQTRSVERHIGREVRRQRTRLQMTLAADVA